MMVHLRTAAVVGLLALSCARLSERGGGGGSSAAGSADVVASTPSSALVPPPPAATVAGPTAARGGVVGVAGIAAWDALAATEKANLRARSSLYLHQSVGQDLEDGAEAIGWKFAYYGPGASSLELGPNGGLFNDVGPIDNGKPFEKLALVQKIASRHKGKLNVVSFSFGYADVRDDDLARVEAKYLEIAKEIRATGARE